VIRLPLSFASPRGVFINALLDGEIDIDGVNLYHSEIGPTEMADLFWRQITSQEFDVSVLSLSTLLMLIDQGRSHYLALPVFSGRGFPHTKLLVRSGSGIRQGHPEDLAGTRLGLLEYQMTAGVWVRGALEHQFGIPLDAIQWHVAPRSKNNHVDALGFRPPNGVPLRIISPSQDLSVMMASGEIDALLSYQGLSVESLRGTTNLFEDPIAEGLRYLSSTDIFPANHILVIRSSLVEKHSWLAPTLVNAFERSRTFAVRRLRNQLMYYEMLGAVNPSLMESADQMFSCDIERNLTTLEALLLYMHEQQLSNSLLQITDVFPPEVIKDPRRRLMG
jgi:4,5-dihydroxyphthalate decarboxylase